MKSKIIIYPATDTHRRVVNDFLDDHKIKYKRNGYYLVKGGKYKVENTLNKLHFLVGHEGSVRTWKRR